MFPNALNLKRSVAASPLASVWSVCLVCRERAARRIVHSFMTPGESLPTKAAVPSKGYALETRAETLNVRTGGDAIRRGDVDEVHAGDVERFEDAVYGEERATIKDKLVESVDQGSTYAADVLEFTVNGRLSVSAVGWPENKLSGEDAMLLGGALAETWTGGALIAAAMSDDLIAGGGVRLTAPLDVSMNTLTGFQERPGTAQADVVLRELYGTLFEREYGAGTHTASVANFSGTIYQTQKAGFRPLMTTALGVRNLIPAAAPGVAPEPSPPAPPPEPASGVGTGTLVAANVGAGAAGSARSADNFQDMGRVAGAAEDMENAAALHHAEDTADTLEELSSAARLGDSDAPDGAASQGLPANFAERLEVDSPYGPIDDIDEPIPELMGSSAHARVDPGGLEMTQMADIAQPMADIQVDLSTRLEELTAGVDAEDAHDTGRLLDIEVGNPIDGPQGDVADGIRVDGSPGLDTSALESPAANPPSVAPSLDDSGAGWSVVGTSGETSPGAAADAPAPTAGNYQTMPSKESGVSPGSTTTSSDAQAVLDASFNRRVPDDFDCQQIHADLDRKYYEHRDNSNWHALEAYGGRQRLARGHADPGLRRRRQYRRWPDRAALRGNPPHARRGDGAGQRRASPPYRSVPRLVIT